MENTENMELDTVLDEWTEVEKVDKELLDKALAEAEKYKGYFKKAKAKENNKSANVDMWSIKEDIMQELKFYTSYPEAEQFKEKINEYKSKWLSYEDSFKLVASKENPQVLIDQQTKAKQEISSKTLDWVANTWLWWVDYSKMTAEQAVKVSDEEFDKYWESKKKK